MDKFLLLFARVIRMVSFGAVSTSLFLHLVSIGLSSSSIGFLFTCILAGDLVMSLPLTTRADTWGRKRVLQISALLKVFSGVVFASTTYFPFLVLAGILGVITPSGGEIGPFTAVEQAALSAVTDGSAPAITRVFAYHNFLGYFAQALGSFLAGVAVGQTHEYRVVLWFYSMSALGLFLVYSCLSDRIEAWHRVEYSKAETVEIEMSSSVPKEVENGEEDQHEPNRVPPPHWIVHVVGLKSTRSFFRVLSLSLLLCLDAFAGGFVMPTLLVGWFEKMYNLTPEYLGGMMAGVHILSGLSALFVIPLVARFGALNTAVFSHIPSNVLLILIPLMDSWEKSIALLLLRSLVSQMDVPARQAFVALVVEPNERSAAGGITMIIRSLGVMLSPFVWGPMIDAPKESIWFLLPCIVAGVIKIVYDFLLYFSFRSVELVSS